MGREVGPVCLRRALASVEDLLCPGIAQRVLFLGHQVSQVFWESGIRLLIRGFLLLTLGPGVALLSPTWLGYVHPHTHPSSSGKLSHASP